MKKNNLIAAAVARTSAAESRSRDERLIAALKALRHPCSYFFRGLGESGASSADFLLDALALS